MKDEQFLQLSPTEARRHANFQGDPEESRLKTLYLSQKGVDLDAARPMPATAAESTSVGTPEPGGLAGLAALLILGGCGLTLWAFVFSVGAETGSAGLYGVPEQVANLDLIALRHMILGCGLAMFVSGWFLFGANHVARALSRRA